MDTDLSANDQLHDYLVRHQVGLLMLAATIQKNTIQPLDATEADVVDAIRRRLRNARGLRTPEDVRRLRTLLAIIKRIRAGAWREASRAMVDGVAEVAYAEPESFDKAVRTVAPVLLDTTRPTRAMVGLLLGTGLVMGRTMGQWTRALEQDDNRRIAAVVQAGVINGSTPDDIARAVVGQRLVIEKTGGLRLDKDGNLTFDSTGGADITVGDGATQGIRAGIETVVRTAMNLFPHLARARYVDLNKSIFREELYVAVLDSRTTPICRSLDGNVYPVGVGPHPPLHPNCRSIRVPLLDGVRLGLREAKPFTEAMIRAEWMVKDPADRGSYSDYRRQRVSDLTGTVPLHVTYQQWLTRQSAAFQDEVLGKARGALFRRGGLTLDKFVNATGRQLTLAELAAIHREAFEAAGLDPDQYL